MTADCPGCEWNGYDHRHDDAEDGPREGCCLHTCGREESKVYCNFCGHPTSDHDDDKTADCRTCRRQCEEPKNGYCTDCGHPDHDPDNRADRGRCDLCACPNNLDDDEEPQTEIFRYADGSAILLIQFPEDEEGSDVECLATAELVAAGLGLEIVDTPDGAFGTDSDAFGCWVVQLRPAAITPLCRCGHPVAGHQTGEGPWTGFCGAVPCECERVEAI